MRSRMRSRNPHRGASIRRPRPDTRRRPWAQYIRSGPEGARGVLSVARLVFCTRLSLHSSSALLFWTPPLNSSEGHLFIHLFLHSSSELLRRSPFHSPFSECSSTFVPPKVTFLEISDHGLHVSQIYPANCLRLMKIVFLQVVFLQVVFLYVVFL